MRTLPVTMIRLLEPFAPLFSKGVFQHVQVLVAGRGRIRAGAVGRFCFRLARSGARAHQRGPQAEPCGAARGEELVLSISVGAHRYAGEDDLRELLAKVDAAMYEAKREGRAWVLSD
jgi:GGDEF domain-containing protein